MSAAHHRVRLSVQAKVLLVVLGFLVLVPAVTMWIVDRQTTGQALEQSRQALKTAEGVFRKYLEIREGNLVTGYRNLVIESGFQALVAGAAADPDKPTIDRRTIDDYLRKLLDRRGEEGEALLLFSKKAELLGAARREGAIAADALDRAVRPLLRLALDGEAGVNNLSLNDHGYTLIAHPVSLGQRSGVEGVLVAAIRVSDATLRDLRDLTGAEVVLVTGGRMIASARVDAGSTKAWLDELPSLRSGQPHEGLAVVVGGEHFLALDVTEQTGASAQGVGYVLLYSYEKSVRALAETRQTILEVSAAGILLSALVVWLFVRRVTRPLVELRDSAEAVGRGDFSRRIERFSDDEVGDLAQEFNRMTGHLQTSRAELERALQTVKATQSQLIQSEKLSAVGQFVAGVAHELNNPLTAVIGFSEILQGTETSEKNRGYLDRIAKSAHRCHKIVSSLLSFARQHPPERRLVSLQTLADDVLELLAYELRTSNITVVKDYAPDLPKTMADAHQLEQVFVNILGNARQAIEPFQRDGHITVRTRAASGRVVIEFADNGPGIRPEHLARIFDPFFTTKPVGKGTGLGLSLVYGIIQEHGGNITARSEVGHGATFSIELPVATSMSPASVVRGASASPFATPGATAADRTVLVIDDEEWILDLAAELLRRDGYEVETAIGGERALELLGRKRFDMIISDWKMPGLNGMRLYEHLRATYPAAATRVLFMTGDVVSDTFQSFLREHRLTCLSKPFAIGEFRAAVARMSAPAD